MSKPNPLRELSRRFPAPPELKSIIDDFLVLPDRSSAIVGVALIESLLEKLMIKKMVEQSESQRSSLFGNRGPLADLSSKILVATAFGIIPSNVADELNRLRNIRNVFAHTMAPISFDTKEVVNELRKSKIVQILLSHFPEKQGTFTNLSHFKILVEIHCVVLSATHKSAGGEDWFAGVYASTSRPTADEAK